MLENELVFRSPDILVAYHPKASDTLFVTFGHLHTQIDGLRFWSDGFLDRCGYASLGFVSANGDWYPEDHMHDALEAARACIRRSGCARVVCYGVSMGAYGALRYAAALGADLVIAFNPQSSINPAFAPHQQHLAIYYRAGYQDPQIIRGDHLAPRNVIIYDPKLECDRICATFIRSMGDVTLLPFYFTGHYSIIAAAECRIADRIIADLLESDGTAVGRARRLFCAHRRKSVTFWLEFALYLQLQGRAPNAVSHAYRMALQLDPTRKVAHVGLAIEAARRGSTHDVHEQLRRYALGILDEDERLLTYTAKQWAAYKVTFNHDICLMCQFATMIRRLDDGTRLLFDMITRPVRPFMQQLNENPHLVMPSDREAGPQCPKTN